MANEITVRKSADRLIESALVGIISRVATLRVCGALTPARYGDVKSVVTDSMIYVVVDKRSQDLDFRGNRNPNTRTATITVRCAFCDDASINDFADECDRVDSALEWATGDNCSALSSVGFACDEFMVDSTSTTFEGGDNPCNVKSYTATIRGRVTNTQTTEA